MPSRLGALCVSVCLFVLLVALSATAQPIRTDIEPSPAGARSVLLWPPGVPVAPIPYLYVLGSPITQPFDLRVGETDHWCDWMDPQPDLEPEQLFGWSDHGAVVFAEPAGHVMGPSNADGWAAVALPLRGGGHHEGPNAFRLGAHYWCGWCYDNQLRCNSPDINGDLVVNLTDVSLFAADFFGQYDYRSDFHWDGYINLGDLSILAQAYGF